MSPRHFSIASVLLAVSISSMIPETATAQAFSPTPLEIAPPPRPQRPYRGLFGSTEGSAAQKLLFEASLGPAFNSGEPAGDPLTSATQSGGAGAGSVTLTYSRTRERFGTYASNTSTFEYYPNVAQYKLLARHVFTSGVYFMATPSTKLTVGPHLKDLPQFTLADLFDAELGQRVPVSQDYPINAIRYRRYGATVDLSQQLSSRSRVVMSLIYAHGKIPSREWNLMLLNGKFRYQVTRAIGVYVGGQYGGQKDINTIVPDQRDVHPRLDVGIDLTKELSFSRRTYVGFSTGSAGNHDHATGETIYRLVGNVRLTREFGRTWLSELVYSRNLRHIETLNEPLFNDALTFNLQGSLNRRWQVQSDVGKSVGRLGTDTSSFNILRGSVQATFALTRELGISGQYSYYKYDVPPGELLVDQSAAKIFPHRIGVYLQLWVPLIHQTERRK